MQRKPGSGGRQKRISGSGSVFRRGSGLGTGPVGSGGGFGGSSGSSGDRGTNRGGGSMGLIALLIAYLLGRGGSGGNGKRKGGCLSRIILLLVILALGYMVVQCVAGDMDGTGGYDGSSDIQLIEAEPTPTPKPQLAQTQAVAADTTVSNLAREKRTQIRGGGQDVYTIMVYMCGTDLESNYGMATSDINEMLHADLSDKVNIIVETGGADKWQNTVISSKVNQIYQIKNEGILRLESDFGKKAMTKAETLTEFIQYCETNFPADRYALIMWDHGGGSNTGYGYDQKFPNGSMTLDVFNKALMDAGCTFDFIGFDACLMATLETAMVAEQYSDYFIASEETEPGCGWYYTNWLTELSRNTSMDTVSIGKTIIDDYTAACRQQSSSNQTTLSLIDLAELSGTVPEAFNKFASSTVELIDSDSYTVVSNARSRAKEFSSGINQIDLINFADNMGTPEAKALSEALRGCIKYNRVSKSLANANGISIYFPYRKLSSMNSMVDIYDEIGMDDAYTNCIRSFASVAAGGQLISSSSGSPLTSLFGDMSGSGNSADMLSELLSAALSGSGSYSSGSSYSSGGSSYSDLYDMFAGMRSVKNKKARWLDRDAMTAAEDFYANNRLDASRLIATHKGGKKVLKLTDAEWDLVQDTALNVFIDDGEGYIDLGIDNTYEFDDDLDLILDYDKTWIALNGQVVHYELMSNDVDGDSYVITGRVPALLNGERVDLILVFTDEDPYGTVAGARIVYGEETDTVMKGLIDIKPGDTLDFLCDYYSYDGEYLDSYMLGNQMTVEGELTITNVSIAQEKALSTFRLTDIYGAEYWTEALEN